MNRRKAKKAFKKKWRSGGRIALLKTVPKGLSVREADKVNEDFQAAFLEKFVEAIEKAILYGTKVVYETPEILPSVPLPTMREPQGMIERIFKKTN